MMLRVPQFLNASIILSNTLLAESLQPRIAHAGGQYQGQIYTNSINVLNENKDKFQLFEIDFHFTFDKKLVCIHN